MTSDELQLCIKMLCDNYNRGYDSVIMIWPQSGGEHGIFCAGKFDIERIVIGGQLVEFEECEEDEEEE